MLKIKNSLSSWLESLVPPALLSFITTLFYYPSLRYPFQFDDIANITKNFSIRSMDGIKLGNRWLAYYLNKLNYQIGKFDPLYYRSFNVVIHLLTGLLIFYTILYVCKGLKKNSAIKRNALLTAFLTAAIFLLHPVQTQTISYVIQARLEGFACFFIMLSALLLVKIAQAKTNTTRYLLTPLLLVSGFVSCGTKEIAIVGPMLLIALDWFLIAQQDWNSFKKRIVIHLAFSATVFGTFLWVEKAKWFTSILGLKMTTGNNRGNIITKAASGVIKPYDYLISEFKVILHYLAIFIWPLTLSVEYDWKLSNSIFAPDSFFPLMALLAIGMFVLYNAYKKRYSFLTFGLTWFFVSVAPRSTIVPSPELICDYKTYIPSIGWIFAIAVGMVYVIDYLETKYKESSPKSLIANTVYAFLGSMAILYVAVVSYTVWSAPYESKTFAILLFVFPAGVFYIIYQLIINHKDESLYQPTNKVIFSLVMLMPLGYGAMSRNIVWSSPVEFWKDIVIKAPFKARGHNNYGVALSEVKQYHEAIKQYKEAIRLDDNYCDPHSNLAVSYSLIGKTDQAIQAIKNALKISPKYPEAYNNLGSFLLQKEDLEGAEYCFRVAIQLLPHYGKAHMNLGRLLLKKGEKEKAWTSFVNATKGDLDNTLGFIALGEAAMKLDKYDEAAKAFEMASKLGKVGEATIFNLANSYFMIKNYDKALGIYEQLCKKSPKNPSYLFNLGETYFSMGKFAQAFNVFNSAKDINGAPPQAHLRVVKCLEEIGNIKDAKRYLNILKEAEAPEWFNKEVVAELDRINNLNLPTHVLG